MTVYLASFKGTKPGWQGWVERITRWVTKSQYSHTETCIGNPFENRVMCVSSVGTDGGVRGKMMQLSPADWDIVPMPWVSEDDVCNFLAAHKGQGYDLIGCVRSVIPFVSREHPEKWFCTETASAIQKIDDAWRFPPGNLHVFVSRLHKLHQP
jgi:hypothetical protein